MEPSKEAISVRIARLKKLFLGQASNTIVNKHYFGREGLIDALIVLYDECNNDVMKKDKNISLFVDKFRSTVLELRRLRVNINDFEIKKLIGRGQFGEVQVVCEKHTGDVYAMKIIKKANTLTQQSVAFYEEERDIMAHAASPWLTSLQYAFQDMSNLYLAMEFHPGGDLLSLFERSGNGLPEEMSRFYLAELVLAIKSLHSMGYVHRDIKPDNILLDRCGHLKLADFGSAAKLTAAGVVVSHMPVGTPEYVAPEILRAMENIGDKSKKSFYGIECDYWSLGIVAYEMIAGTTPFCGDDPMNTFSGIMNHKSGPLAFPAGCDAGEPLRDVVTRLLEDSSSRLGHVQLVQHKFFKEVDWNNLRNTVPPFVPTVNGVDDTSNFAEIKRMPQVPSIENYKTKKQFSGSDLPFIGFTFVQEHGDDFVKEITSSSCTHLDGDLALKNKEIKDLWRKIHVLQQGSNGRNKDFESLEQKVEEKSLLLEDFRTQYNKLELDYERCKKDKLAVIRTLELSKEEQKTQEAKALSMIRDMKANWKKKMKEEVDELNEEIRNQAERNADLLSVNLKMNVKLQKQDEELLAAKDEMAKYQSLVQMHNDKLSKARNLSRQSVTGAEFQVKQLSESHEKQIANLKDSLLEEQQKCIILEEELRKQDEEINTRTETWDCTLAEFEKLTQENLALIQQHEEKDARIEQLEAKLGEAHISHTNTARQEERHSERERIAELEIQLRMEQAEGKEMKDRLSSLEEVLNESMMSRESMLASREAEQQQQLTSLTAKLKAATNDRDDLQERLQEATQSEADVSLKVNSLEQMLQQFQRGLAKLEEENSKLKAQNSEHNHHPSETSKISDAQKEMLEAQIEKLELQLEKLRETSVLDRKEKSELESKIWKINKDLENSKLDMRIAQREAKTAEEQIKVLQDEKKKFQDKAAIERTSLDERLQAENVKIVALEAHVKELSKDLETAKKDVASKTKAVEDWKSNVSKLTNEIKSTKSSTDALSTDLNLSRNKCGLLQGKNETLNKEITTLKIKIAEALERERSLVSAMKQETIKFSNLEQNVNLLKDTCAMLEDQLVDYEKLASNYESKVKTSQKDKDDLQTEVETLSKDLQSARQSTNEERSLKLRAELRAKQLEAELAARTEDLAASESRAGDLATLSQRLTGDVDDLEERSCSADAELRGARRQLEATRAEQNALKEEISRLLTQIHSLKESNFQLTTKLENSEDYNQELIERLSNTKNQLEEVQAFYKHREFKTNATVEQQTKLIDFLQRKVEEAGKKKKTFTEKIFGTNQKENIPLVAPFSYKEIHSMLCQERAKNQTLNEKLMRAQAQLVSQKGDQILDAINVRVPFESPQTKLAMTKLVQSPGTQNSNFKRQYSMQRMHHNIPHRFELRLCMRATKCATCLDSIHFGRNAAVCQECHITAHPKCSLLLPTTCGLPVGFAKHFSHSWRDGQTADTDSPSADSDDNTPVRMEGYVKLPQRGKSCWERKYLVLEGETLHVYEHEPSKNMEPVEKIQVCTKDGSTSILSAVPYSDVIDTAKTDLPYILKVVITPRTTCWPGTSLLIMALSFPDKQAWVSALESVIHRSNQTPSLGASQVPRYQGTAILSLPKAQAIDLNCVLQLSLSLLLIGAHEGLYSLRINDKNAMPVKIAGVTEVHQVALVQHLGVAIMIAGESRALVQCECRQLVASAEAAECSNPSIATKPILVTTSGTDACCHLFAVNSDHAGHHARTILCAATADKLVLLTWSINQNAFNVAKVLDTSEPCSCIHFTPHSILVGCNKFFEIDLRDFTTEEFLDAADKSLHNAVEGAQQLNSFPVAILDVSKSHVDLEYLLCFNEFGVFVDKYGQRTRGHDIKWSHLPMAFSYRKPYLFIFHFTSVEVMRLTPGSFTVSRDDSTDSAASYPRQTFIELSTPRYLGPATTAGDGAVYLSHVSADREALRLVRMEGGLVCREDADVSCSSLGTLETKRNSVDGADLNGCASSEFSFTSSLVNSLDGDGDGETEDSPRSTSDEYAGSLERRVRFDSRTLHTDL